MANLHKVGEILSDDGFEAKVLSVSQCGDWIFGKVFDVTVKIIQCEEGCFYAASGRKSGDVVTFKQHLTIGDLAE